MSGMDEDQAHARAGGRIGARLPTSGRGRRWSGHRAIGLALLVAVAPPSTGTASIGGPFELVDPHGATRTDEDFRGASMLISFGFTYCPDSCPTALLKITNAHEDLAALAPIKAERVVPVLISVDPERDTPEVLRRYAENFHPRLVAPTGAPRELGRAYGVFFAKVLRGEPGEYLMDHTGFVYLIGPDGEYVEHFESDASVGDLVDALQRHVLISEVGGS
jgi:cytochrome oxidase Cu insertion factor (SCO1/SenC/PrrC family)